MDVRGLMKTLGRVNVIVLFLLVLTFFATASTPVIDVVITELVSETVAYDQVYGPDSGLIEAPGELGENRTGYSRTNRSLEDVRIFGTINISNVELVGGQTISSINVTVRDTDNVTAYEVRSKPAYAFINSSVSLSNPASAKNITFYIPELRAGDSVIINYSIIQGIYKEPINFTEEYSSWKVLTGNDIEITLNVTNTNNRNIKIYDLEIYKVPQQYESLTGGVTSFDFHSLSGDDASNANIFNSGGKSILNWNASAGSLSLGESRQIIFNSTAPTNISIDWANSSNWATWLLMGNLSANFKMNGTISGMNIQEVTGVSTAARLAVTKERINVSGYWNTTINVTNDALAPIDYELREISLWATQYNQYSDPGDVNTWVANTTVIATSFSPLTNVYANATWFPRLNFSSGTSIDNYTLVFNYSLVPVVWATADFVVLDDGTQIYKLNQSRAGVDEPYLFLEEVYVLLGGYLIKVTKELAPQTTGSNRYKVNITIENIGSEITPELVTVFDLVPKDFYPLYYSSLTNAGKTRPMTDTGLIIRITGKDGALDSLTTADSNTFFLGAADSGNIATGPYAGYWGYHIDLKAINATSDGDGRYTPSLSDKELYLTYYMEGNDSLARVENAYLVGVDPIRLEGANPSQSVASRLSVYSSNSEMIILFSTLILSATLLGIAVLMLQSNRGVKK